MQNKQKTYVIGDIHGNLDALNEALEKAPIKKGDKIVFLGDYGDGFPHTSGVVDKLLELNKDHECIFLLGNHDVWVADWIAAGNKPDIWTTQGGDATIESYMKSAKFHDDDHIKFWTGLLLYYINAKNQLFVHGGWDGKKIFGEAVEARMTDPRHPDLVWDRSLAEGVTTEHTDKFKNIFIGHTATRNHLPYNNKNVWNVDTGAGWSGKLTVMDVDTKEYWQSSKNKYSPRG